MTKSVIYSPTTGGFYAREIHGDNIPADSVEITTEEHAALIEGQSQGKRIVADGNGFPILVDPPKPTAVEIMAIKWIAIKAERDRRKAGGVKVDEKWFHSDDGSRIQQIGLVMMGANLPAGLQWKTMDGSFITMTQTLAGQIFATAAGNDIAIFAAAEAHRVAMEASTDPANYDFTTGWPKAFGE